MKPRCVHSDARIEYLPGKADAAAALLATVHRDHAEVG
jgi:hypothetical protein